MINGKTFYQVLGLLTSTDGLVIRAAYRSLSSKYHPDKWTGEKAVGHDRMAEINAAYDTLGDEAKRSKYDEELRRQSRYDDVSDIENSSTEFEGIYSEHSDAWDLALQFYPNLNPLHERLKTINSSLAYMFKTILIENKDYARGNELAEQLEQAFLVKYFGKDKSILALAKYLITNNYRPAARELNRIVTVMSNSVTFSQVLEVLRKKYENVIDPYSLFQKAKWGNLNTEQKLKLIAIAGAKKINVEPHWWLTKYTFIWTDGEERRLHEADLMDFIRWHVLPMYET